MIRFILIVSALLFGHSPYAQVDIVDVYSSRATSDQRNFGNGAVGTLIEADRLIQQGRTQEAILKYNNAVQMWPNWAPIYLKRANALLRAGRTTEAQEDVEQAYRISTNSVVLFSIDNPAQKFRKLATPAAYAQTGHPAAEIYSLQMEGDLFQVDRKLDELEASGQLEDAEIALLRGNQRFLQENPLEAIAYYDWAIQRGTTAELLHNRGLARILTYNYPNGCADLEQSGKLGYSPAIAQYADLCSF